MHTFFSFFFLVIFFFYLKSQMPVRSPEMTTVDQPMGSPKSLTEREETNENVSKEKMTNMKLMMKTFVLGALREKEQVNYFISC